MNADESLILGNGSQLALLEVDDYGVPASAYQSMEQAGRFTGDRFFSSNPKLYRAVAALLARGVPYREIAEICSVSTNTVFGVSFREAVPIETLRERIGRLQFDVAALTMECIRDLLADPDWRKQASAKDLSIIHGIAFSNGQLANGGATARIDTLSTPAAGHDDYERFIRNVTPTSSRAEDPGQKNALPASIDIEASVPGEPPSAAST